MRLGATYCPETRPDGYICLAISENRLAFPLFRDALVNSRPEHISSTGYDNPRGGMRFRTAIASFLSEYVAKREGTFERESVCERAMCVYVHV